MKVTNINVRLDEGGAAVVALDIHQRLMLRGVDARFFYGYGRRALPNPRQAAIEGSAYIASAPQAISNFFLQKLINLDPIGPSSRHKFELEACLSETDVLHLHVLHSHFFPLGYLAEVVLNAAKRGVRVVWTMHDHWVLTGRCAFTEGCVKWKSGCGQCPTKSNYPPVWLDLSGPTFKKKRSLIEKIAAEAILVAPSQHVASDMQSGLGVPCHVIANGLPLSVETEIDLLKKNVKKRGGDLANVLVIAHDLSYAGKTDPAWINSVIGLKNTMVHCVGKHSPFAGPTVKNHGPIFDRKRLMQLMFEMDAMLFTSEVDNCPMVVLEALSSGVPVIAKKSPAASEILRKISGRCAESLGDALDHIMSRNFLGFFTLSDHSRLGAVSQAQFGGDAMVDQYMLHYQGH